MAVDPATRPTTRRPDRPATANRHRGGRPAAPRPATEARCSTVGGRRRARDRLEAPGPKTGRTGDGRGVASTAYASTTTRTRSATLLRANPYPEVTDRFCRLPLPTLFYAARGCSPRRPAADIGTNRREDSAWPSLEFSRGFQGRTTLTEKRELFPDPRRLLRVHSGRPDETKEPRTLGSGSASGSGIRTGFPLAPWAIRKRLRPWYEDLSPGLGSTDSWTTAVHKKPFSTAAPEGPSRVFATTTKICTDGGSRRSRDLPFDAHRRAILLVGACRDRPPRATAGPTMPPTAEYRHDAPAPSIFRASCFGSNQRLSWSLNTRRFRRLNSAFGSSRSASSAYQKWPTKRLGFRRRLRTRFTRCTSVLLPAPYSAESHRRPYARERAGHIGASYPEGNFGWNQLLDGSISLSPLYPAQTIDLHFTIFRVPTCALRVRPRTAEADLAETPPTADQRDFERRWVRSLGHRPHRKRLLGPCFKTGRKVARTRRRPTGPRLRRGRVDGSCRRASRPGAPGFGAIGHAETRPPRRTATRALRPAPNESRRPLTERKIRPAVRPTVNSPGGDSRALLRWSLPPASGCTLKQPDSKARSDPGTL
ncbi:hypothetical protein KEM48_014630 [Puccinia striiformis f. sp. tritici PST-130]|nr:hypothetical protein KEM48_014630 [Puccinia striiformis f. sp. tritici PST-130]